MSAETYSEIVGAYYSHKSEKDPISFQLLLSFDDKDLSPKLGILGRPSRTLPQVFGTDIAAVIHTIRRIYIPYYFDENGILEQAIVWVGENREDFREFRKLPHSVLLYIHTLTLVDAFREGIGSKDPRELTSLVGFSPGTKSFETDIRSATFETYSAFSVEGGARPSRMESISDTKIYYLIRRLYTLCDSKDDYFIEGADLLTMVMFRKYFLGLKERVGLFTETESKVKG